MYPTVWSFIGDLASFYIYDLIDDDKTKNRIQQMVGRLRDENGNLTHEVYEIAEEYKKELKAVFKAKEVEHLFFQYFTGMIEDYQNLILDEPSFLSEKNGHVAAWERHLVLMQSFYKDVFPRLMNDYQYLKPNNHMEIFFPFNYRHNHLPFNGALDWFMNLNFLNQRKLAERITPDVDQLNSTVRRVQRWKKGNIPNFRVFMNDISPILNEFPDEKQILGIKIIFYISIAFSRLYQKNLSNLYLGFERDYTEVERDLMLTDFVNKQTFERKEYSLIVLKPCMELLEKVKIEKGSVELKMLALTKMLSEIEPLIEKYHAEVFIYFIKARIYYMHDNYEEAVENYQMAFELGRYRIGRQIKVLICEFLHSCRKLGKKSQFRKVHDWQSFIIDQKDYQLLSFDVKPFEQVWEEFNHDSKYFVLTNFKSRRIYS